MPNDDKKKKTITQVVVMVLKSFLVENFIKNLTKHIKNLKTMPYQGT